jgi:hypothetical protein
MKVSAPTVPVIEVENEGLISLLQQNVTLFCMNYIYTGKLVGVNDKYVKLEKASVVYETGAFTDKNFKDAQPLPNDLYVMHSAIESFTILH